MISEVLFFVLVLCNTYLFAVSWAATRNRKKHASEKGEEEDGLDSETGSVLLVIAHPDDEAMFFVPTINVLVNNGTAAEPAGSLLYILCLSNGNGDGLGAVRAKEMVDSAKVLGIPTNRVRVLDDPALQDGMDIKWAATAVAKRVQEAVEEWGISKILTFDDYGVSGHPNHIDTYRGVMHFLNNSEWGKPNSEDVDYRAPRRKRLSEGKSEPTEGQQLKKTKAKKKKAGQVYLWRALRVLRKYLGFFDVLTSLMADTGVDKHQCLCNIALAELPSHAGTHLTVCVVQASLCCVF